MACFVTPRRACKLRKIPVSSIARVSNGSASVFVAGGGQPRQLENLVSGSVAAAMAATPPAETPKTVGYRKVLPTI